MRSFCLPLTPFGFSPYFSFSLAAFLHSNLATPFPQPQLPRQPKKAKCTFEIHLLLFLGSSPPLNFPMTAFEACTDSVWSGCFNSAKPVFFFFFFQTATYWVATQSQSSGNVFCQAVQESKSFQLVNHTGFQSPLCYIMKTALNNAQTGGPVFQ